MINWKGPKVIGVIEQIGNLEKFRIHPDLNAIERINMENELKTQMLETGRQPLIGKCAYHLHAPLQLVPAKPPLHDFLNMQYVCQLI